MKQLRARRVPGSVADHTGPDSDRLDEVTLSDPALANEHQVVVAPDEVPRGQLLDLYPVDRLGVEVPVEFLQRLSLAKPRLPDPSLDGPVAPPDRLMADQQVDEVEMRQLFSLGSGKRLVELLARQRDS